MLNEPGHTSWDLCWTMFGIHIRVHPMFWLTSAFLGFGASDNDPMVLLVWVACVFVSILLHEMGHVLMGRVFGADGHIVLVQFGGLAVGINVRRRWQRILVSFAGPGIQFLFLGALILLIRQTGIGGRGSPPLMRSAISDLIYINLFWPILNLLPIWPLDGGQISREVCEGVGGRTGTKVSLLVSIVVACAAALGALEFLGQDGIYTIIFFAVFAFIGFQELAKLQAAGPRHYDDDRDSILDRRRPRRRDDDMPWERSDDRVRRGPDEGYRPRDDSPRRRDDELPWER